MREIAASAGIILENAWHISFGNNLAHIWENPEEIFWVNSTAYGKYKKAIESYPWDVITIQPFIGDSGKEELDALEAFLSWIDSTKNRNSTIYLYCTWPQNSSDFLTYTDAWMSAFDDSDAEHIENREFFRYLEKSPQLASRTIKTIHVGEVLYLFDKWARKGMIPGFSSAGDLYRDSFHLNNAGRYIAGLTFFCMVTKINPFVVPDFNAYQASAEWPCDRTLTVEQKRIFRMIITYEMCLEKIHLLF